jgi:GntR family transcriptional repressor for pyruvate dehydrogenase complex
MDPTVASSAQRHTLPAHVARHILELVTREGLRPGDRVPSEVQIGRDLQVSRGSVREAYRSLAALGILEIESGRRPRLKPVCPNALTQVVDYALNTAQVEIAHVLATRRALELHSAQLAARHASEAQRRTLRDLAAQMRAAAADPPLRAASDMAIHSTIAQASGNPLNALLLMALHRPLDNAARSQVDESRSEAETMRMIEAHEAIIARICAGDAPGAAAAMSEHFDLAAQGS